ncbi:MAG: HIT domain-containing protein [Candidatus Kapaibacterium sp.]
MERLWSPWRSQFIASADETLKEGSPFTAAFQHPERDVERFMVHRGDRAFIIMNLYPYNAGHLLVVPVREVGDFLELSEDESGEIMRLIRFGIAMLKRALKPQAFNVGMNQGRTAGAAIDTHVHFHIVPRWNGDTNFMPVLDETRVISENMREVYEKLIVARDELLSEIPDGNR